MGDIALVKAKHKALLETITDIGVVEDRVRWPRDSTWDSFLGQFSTTIAGTKTIRGWMITLGRPPIEVRERTSQGGYLKKINVEILGYCSFVDASDSAATVQSLMESVLDKLLAYPYLDGLARRCDPPQGAVYDVRSFGGVRCHFVTIAHAVYITKYVTYAE